MANRRILNSIIAAATLLAVIGNTPQEFSALFLGGFSVYERVIKAAGIQPE
jgi:hypothetical protein